MRVIKQYAWVISSVFRACQRLITAWQTVPNQHRAGCCEGIIIFKCAHQAIEQTVTGKGRVFNKGHHIATGESDTAFSPQRHGLVSYFKAHVIEPGLQLGAGFFQYNKDFNIKFLQCRKAGRQRFAADKFNNDDRET
ncbi:MAG: hypothetical protein CMG85_06150 [Marinobacter sp.]|nr:hypothetical protein [Marinobacter sp.]MAO26823.1 hypothetical protein [Roseovarius sp.]